MIAGLHWTAWLLLILAIFPALALVTVFYFKRRRRREGT